MKIPSAGRVSLLGVALAGVRVSDAARETMSVSEGGITFTVARYDDGRNKPYRLKFRQDNTRSLYMFNSATLVTNIKIGTGERYEVLYDSDDNLESVELTSSTRRELLAEEESDEAAINGRRLEFVECTDCEEAWDALCAGVTSVCDLVDYGSPLSAAGAASIDTMCETFGSACSSYEASEACDGQCTGEDVTSSSNSCLDPTSDDYKCAFSGDTNMVFTECDLENADILFLPACFEEFGKTNVGSIRLDENHVVTEIPEGTFAGLSELTSLDLYSNKLTTLPVGLFSGLTKVEFLDLAFNDLVALPEGVFSDLESLQILRIFANELTPESLPVGIFSGLSQLQELFLSRNQLSDFTGLEGLFGGLTELVNLGLSENQVTIIPDGLFAGLAKLEELSLWINSLTAVPAALEDLPALRNLDLGDNSVTSLVPLSALTQLESLSLEFNDPILLEDTFSALTNLEFLSLTGCGLTTLPDGLFSPLQNLERLDLWENSDLQCVPSNTATSLNIDSDDVLDGTCECTPVEAVTCDEDLACESGSTGYTCV